MPLLLKLQRLLLTVKLQPQLVSVQQRLQLVRLLQLLIVLPPVHASTTMFKGYAGGQIQPAVLVQTLRLTTA